jgi:hypothetical protein
MRRRNFRNLNPRDPRISIREHNDLLKTAEGLSRVNTGPTVASSSNSVGSNFGVSPADFWAKLSFIGQGSPVPLSWSEQKENADGTTSDFADQHFGYAAGDLANPNQSNQPTGSWPAFDFTGTTHAVNDIVRLTPSKGGEYYEVIGGAAPGGSSSFIDDPIIIITYVSDVFCNGGTLAIQKNTRAVEGRKGSFNLSLTGPPTGGSFTLVINGQQSGAIQWNASAATIQTILQAATSAQVVVNNGPLPAAVQIFISSPDANTSPTLAVGQNNLTPQGAGVSLSGPN